MRSTHRSRSVKVHRVLKDLADLTSRVSRRKRTSLRRRYLSSRARTRSTRAVRGQAAWRRERTRIVAAEPEALGKCFRHQMRAGARVKFPGGISHVRSDRVMRDVQLVGDLATGVSESHQPHNLAFAGRERNGFGAGRDCPAEARSPARGAQDDKQDEIPPRDDFGGGRVLNRNCIPIRTAKFRIAGKPRLRYGRVPFGLGSTWSSHDYRVDRAPQQLIAAIN